MLIVKDRYAQMNWNKIAQLALDTQISYCHFEYLNMQVTKRALELSVNANGTVTTGSNPTRRKHKHTLAIIKVSTDVSWPGYRDGRMTYSSAVQMLSRFSCSLPWNSFGSSQPMQSHIIPFQRPHWSSTAAIYVVKPWKTHGTPNLIIINQTVLEIADNVRKSVVNYTPITREFTTIDSFTCHDKR